MAIKLVSALSTPQFIQFQNSSGQNTGKIETSGNDLVISNAVGNVLFGDGASDIYIGDGVNSVDILFEQSGAIRGEGSVTLTLGSSNTTLNVYNPQMANGMTLTSTMTMGTGAVIDFLPDTGAIINLDGQTILKRNTFNGGITLGHDDAVIIAGGDTYSVLESNISLGAETVFLGAEGGVTIYAFPNNDTAWSNRKEFIFSNDTNFYLDGRVYPSDQATNYVDSTRIANWQNAYGWGNHAGLYLGATAKAADSNLLDGIDSSAFLRSNTSDTFGNANSVLTIEGTVRSNNNSNGNGPNFNVSTTNKAIEEYAYRVDRSGTVAGGIRIDGNISIPDYIFHTGDTNTYMQFHAADQWRVVTGGGERLEVNNSQVTVASNLVVGGDTTTGKITISKQSQHVTQGSISASDAHLDLYNNWESDTDQKGSIITFTDNYYGSGTYNKTTRAAIKGGTDTTGNTADGYLEFYTDSAGANSPNMVLRLDKNKNAYFSGSISTASNGSSSQWNTAYGWGNHASVGYLTTSSAASTYAPLASPALTGTPTAPTAGSSTNTTQIATTAFVQTAVSNLVDSAPGALNTLNELAAALGDDANFSTTITNSIATKLPLAGGTITGNVKFNDNVELRLGSGADLKAYHSGTHTYFDNNVGDLILRNLADDKDIVFQSDNGSGGTATYMFLDGSQTNVNFQKDAIWTDGKKALFGGSGDLQIYHDGSNSYLTDTGTGNMYLNAADNMYFQVYATGERWITLTKDAGVQLFYNDVEKFQTQSTGTKTYGVHNIEYNGIGLDIENSASSGSDTGIRIRGARNGQEYATDNLTSYILLSNFDDNTTPNNYDLVKIGAGMYDANSDTGYFRVETNNGTSLTKAFDIDKNQDAKFYGDVDSDGNITASNLNVSNWNTAYGWGNHASAGYSTATGVANNADNYGSWNLKTNDVQRTTVGSGGDLNLVAGTNVSLGYSAGGTVTITSTDTNTQLTDAQVRGKISGTGLISYNSSTGVISTTANNYSLPAGSSATRGGFKIGYAENGKNYPVEVSSEKMYVNVPWTDTNTDTVTSVGVSGSETTGTITLVGAGATTLSQSGQTIEIRSTNTTYTVGDGGLTQKNFTTTLKNKLDGIASGAEVNVQSNWNATSGDALILNKPTIPSGSQLVKVYNNVDYIASGGTTGDYRDNYGPGVTVYEGYSVGANTPHSYDSTVQFMSTTGQGFELSADWLSNSTTPLKIRSLRDCCQGWSTWRDVAVAEDGLSGTFYFNDSIHVGSKITHSGDTNTYVQFDADRIRLVAGGTTKFDSNSTYATQTYVNTAVSNLVSSAPAALDTLNELAAALGDDANFSTTTTTALGNRLRIDTASQGLTSTQKSNGRTNLGLGTAATSASTDFVSVSGDTISGNIDIVHAANATGLTVRVTGGAVPTTPQFKVGRDTSQYWGVFVDDGTANLVHRQDEIGGGSNHHTQFQIWSSGGGTHSWKWQVADNAGANGAEKMKLTADSELTLGSGSNTITNTKVGQWDTAYGWGDHSTEGYLTAETFGSSDVIMSLSGDDVIAGESITLAGGLSYNSSTNTLSQTDNNTTYSVGDGGLTQKNFTTTLKTKLDGIAASANNYTHPSYNGDDFSVDTGALTGFNVVSDIDINVTTDALGHVTDANGSVATRALQNLNIPDTRAGEIAPDSYLDKALSLDFTDEFGSLGSWYSGLTLKGWSGSYAAWQLISNSDNNTADQNLYFRSGSGATWGTMHKVYHSGNLTAGTNVSISSGGVISSTDTNTTYSVGDGGLTQKNFTTTLKTKLDGIEASADVTDTTNVVAALTAGTNVQIAANGTISATDTNTTYSVGDGGLTQKNFTTTLKTKLDGIAAGADVTPSWVPSTDPSYATQSYVGTQISNLVASAPSTLDTLNELAAALGDDPNFATTMSTALGNRLRVDISTQNLTSTQKSNGRTNLGLGTAATFATGDFATSAQGTHADTAFNWGDHGLAGYVTSSGVTSVTVGTGLDVATGTTTPNITLDLSEFTDMTAAMVGTDEFIVLDAGAERRKAANEISLSIFNDDLNYLEDITPAAPAVTATNIVGETIEVVFSASTTADIDYYQVWSSVDGGSYGLIAQIPDTDFASSMTVIDASFNVSGTIAYRVYAVKSGVYSSPGTASKAFTAPTLDVLNMSVVSLNTAYYIQYDLPDSRFVDHIEIYMDSEASAANLTRTGATLVYSGNNTSYMYAVGSNNNYHQFWVEVVES